MAFLKKSSAIIHSVDFRLNKWSSIRRANTRDSASKIEASLMRLAEFRPDEFLFTHATIIASVDTEADIEHYIKPNTSQFVNDNGDCWSREVARMTYHTFRGAENYLEHVQIPHLSKGKIIDAAIRNVGINDYVDILVATNRKHEDIIERILSGELNSMSMGAKVAYTICSKCGNKAHDEVELCDDIKYNKGSYFTDKEGNRRIIAELCGKYDDPESNVFIEASWVANPAFAGAVVRNIIEVTDPILVELPENVVSSNQNMKAASFDDVEHDKESKPSDKRKFKNKNENDSVASDGNENLVRASIQNSNRVFINNVIQIGQKHGWRCASTIFNRSLVFDALYVSDRENGDKRLSKRAFDIMSKDWENIKANGHAVLEAALGRKLQSQEIERLNEIMVTI